MTEKKTLGYYIHVEEMRPLGDRNYAAKPILSKHFTQDADEIAPPIGEQWGASEGEAISKVRKAMQAWAASNGYSLSET